MLRTLQGRRQATQSFVCWKCLTRSNHNASSKDLRRPESTSKSKALENGRVTEIRRQFNAGRTTRTSLESSLLLPEQPPPLPPPTQPNIRERLRQWELENAASLQMVDVPVDRALPGDVVNGVVHPHYNEFEEDTKDVETGEDGFGGLDFDRFEMVDVGEYRSFFLPGDLVELKSVGNRRQELAIFVRDVGKQIQFYTMSGRWINRTTRGISFFVPGFVEPCELDAIRPYLPEGEVDSSIEGRLQSFKDSVAISIGKPLIKKMTNFWNEADATYQAHASKLDSAHKTVADIFQFKYSSLDEIANKVLGKIVPKGDDGQFPWSVLYAVHRSILKDDIGFRPIKELSTMRVKGLYEINGFSEVDCIRRVAGWVRKYSDYKLGKVGQDEASPYSELLHFASNARKFIDLSRANREFTPYGMIGPSLITLEPGERFRSGHPGETFSPQDLQFIRFLESWACLKSLGSHSLLNGVGSTILRVIDRYQEMPLSRTTAWTCLQELGALPPWETPVSFDLRLPYAGRQDAIDHRLHPNAGKTGGMVPDKLESIRKDWNDTPVYCVDDAHAHEIDDGFSLEATDAPDEYWVHIHTADPAAHLDPEGLTTKFAESLTESIYLPERVISMFRSQYVQTHWSLAPDRPCLTISAKMNLNGDILESKITPGFIRNVQFLTPVTLREVVSGSVPPAHDVYIAGTFKSETAETASRPLVGIDQLSERAKEDMKILHAIGQARTKQLEARGGISSGNPVPSVSVAFDGFEWAKPKTPSNSLQYFGDPTIRLEVKKEVDGSVAVASIDTVGSLMILAGEVAARWCSERNIPIPYRITPRNPDKQDPSEYYHTIVLPSKDKDGVVPIDLQMEYFKLIGKVQPSSIPGPHVALGLEVFAKVTSPLRRFGDLVAQFQIEAALLEEARSGQSLVGSSNENYLPISKARLDQMLPRMASRERLISTGQRASLRAWMLQLLVRAWKFGEVALPTPLEFAVRSINPDTKLVGGLVSKLLLGGQLSVPSWTTADEIKIGDRFEVEIEDIRVYDSMIVYKAIRPLESEDAVKESEATLASKV